jgi:hypothetical protein
MLLAAPFGFGSSSLDYPSSLPNFLAKVFGTDFYQNPHAELWIRGAGAGIYGVHLVFTVLARKRRSFRILMGLLVLLMILNLSCFLFPIFPG